VFSAEWLALREPADRDARSRTLTAEVVSGLNARNALHALDLASGTGANARYIAEFLDSDQHWMLADHDAVLLASVGPQISAWAHARNAEVITSPAATVVRTGNSASAFSTMNVDLRRLDDPSLFAGRTLVTASALLDLVSEAWIGALADRCREVAASVLFALTYDGRMSAVPAEPEDELIRALVNRHQQTDKGFGPAAGPRAVNAAVRVFSARGYELRRSRSDWHLGRAEASLQRQLIEGWAEAASSISPENISVIDSWRRRRLAHVDGGRSTMIVGHEDVGGSIPASLVMQR
jgi:hypothetical protein